MAVLTEKAERMLVEGRVRVVRVYGGEAAVDVTGYTGHHRVVCSAGKWGCGCAGFSFRGRCSHIEASRRVLEVNVVTA